MTVLLATGATAWLVAGPPLGDVTSTEASPTATATVAPPTPTTTPLPPTATVLAAPTVTPAPALESELLQELCAPEERVREIEGAILIAQDGQVTHLEWIAYLQSDPEFDTTNVGDIPAQRRWVDGYQVIIDTLQRELAACRRWLGQGG